MGAKFGSTCAYLRTLDLENLTEPGKLGNLRSTAPQLHTNSNTVNYAPECIVIEMLKKS